MVSAIVPRDGEHFYCLLSNDCTPENASTNSHTLPIFKYNGNGHGIEYANADLLIVKDDTVVAQIEIEEADRSPIKISGKIMTSRLSHYFEYGKGTDSRERGPFPFADKFLFIQIVMLSVKNYKRSKKPEQWSQVEMDINNLLGYGLRNACWVNDRTVEYHLLWDGRGNSINDDLKRLLGALKCG